MQGNLEMATWADFLVLIHKKEEIMAAEEQLLLEELTGPEKQELFEGWRGTKIPPAGVMGSQHGLGWKGP